MSRTSTATLIVKLRQIEVGYDEMLHDGLVDLEMSARRRGVENLIDVLNEAIDLSTELALDALDRFTEESAIAIGRDLNAVGSNSGRLEAVRSALENFDPFEATEQAKAVMEMWRDTARTEFAVELNRQRRIALVIDDDPDEGLFERVLSPVRLGLVGRPGKGLLYSIPIASGSILVTVGWEMVNAQRLTAMELFVA